MYNIFYSPLDFVSSFISQSYVQMKIIIINIITLKYPLSCYISLHLGNSSNKKTNSQGLSNFLGA